MRNICIMLVMLLSTSILSGCIAAAAGAGAVGGYEYSQRNKHK